MHSRRVVLLGVDEARTERHDGGAPSVSGAHQIDAASGKFRVSRLLHVVGLAQECSQMVGVGLPPISDILKTFVLIARHGRPAAQEEGTLDVELARGAIASENRWSSARHRLCN